jgi:hypothetical protein
MISHSARRAARVGRVVALRVSLRWDDAAMRRSGLGGYLEAAAA